MKYTKEYFQRQNIAIMCNNRSQAEELCDLLDIYEKHRITHTDLYLSWDALGERFDFYDSDTCKEDQIIVASEVISNIKASNPHRKLLGYKAPFDMFGGSVKKDELYKIEGITGKAIHQDFGYEMFVLPSEIVEQWEPVYEEEKPTFGSFSDIIKHFKGASVFIDGYIKIDDKNPDGDFIYIENDKFNLTDSFKKELTELGIKI